MLLQPSRIDPQTASRARRMVMEQGTLPAGLLRGDIEASWNRCLELGLRLDQKPDLSHLASKDVDELQNLNHRLISSSIPEMEALCRHFGERDCMVMLCDANATILKSLGESRFIDKASRYSMLPGTSWQENVGGTNAFGTVLKQQKPLMIQGGEHYFEAISGFSCSAAPIFDPSGTIAGVLDVTSDDGLASCHNLGLVSMSSRLIENRLFTDQYGGQVLVSVHSRPEFVDSLWQGLLAFSVDGRLLAMNREAGECLGFSSIDFGRRDFENLFGLRLPGVIDQSLRSPRKPLVLRKGESPQIYGRLLHVPGSNSVSISVDQGAMIKKRPRPAREGDITLDDVVLEDVDFSRAAKRGAKALNHQIPLLLLGETGSGKEALARALHDESVRGNSNFVALNCAAIPEGLIESELFGYQDGAFTGARRGGMQGKVQQADGGILFLDEIGDMPVDMQARLLRVLQDRCITPLGSSKVIPVDITVVCATHRDLKQMVAEGSFREDLYYRLNGMAIRIPSLRDRHNLPGLVEYMLQQMAGGCHGVRIDPELMSRFEHYRWPGNVRQLQTVLKTSLAFLENDQAVISEEHMTDDFLQELRASDKGPMSGMDSCIRCADSSPKTLKTAQIEMIKQAIEANDGNMSATAQSLGISRATLYRRLQNDGIKVVSDKQELDS